MKAVKTRYAASVAVALAAIVSGSVPEALAQREQEINNLRAFAKLYGYVRYFHPSDEAAQIPWDAFAVHGTARVKGARDQAQLRRALEELFYPIAPTVQIFSSSATPPSPLVGPRSDTTGLRTVAWQHYGVGLGEGGMYRSIRVNRDNRIAAGRSSFGTITQAIDAGPYHGRRIRLRAFVRAVVEGSGNQAQLWLRVDRAGGPRGFFDNMGDRPITSAEWRQYEIEGVVAEDATRIVFGGFLLGAGEVWLDGFELAFRDDDPGWTSIDIAHPGFEEWDESGRPIGWTARSDGYDYRVEQIDVHAGAGSLTIRDRSTIVRDAIFDSLPRVGDVVTRPIGGGLTAQIPLALYGDSLRTLGPETSDSYETLLSALRALDSDAWSADREAVRLGGVVVAWNVFQHFYPYFDVVGTDWDAELTRTLQAAVADPGAREFYETLNRLVAALHDGHGRVFHPAFTPNAILPMRLAWIEDELVITAAVDTTTFRPGDIIRTIDGRDVLSGRQAVEALMSGSPQWKGYRSAREIGAGAEGEETALLLQRADTSFEITVTRVRQPEFPTPDAALVREIEPGIWYVNLDRAEMAEITEHIEEIASARGVVFDLRNYPNGNHAVLDHLLSEPDTSDAWMRVRQAIYPDRERTAGWGEYGWSLQPASPHIEGRVVFITDGRAISYAESFMSFVEHYRLAEIVGGPTAGANGNVNPFTLPGGFRVRWTGMRVLKHDGSQHHLVGIQPTVPLAPTIAGVRAGRDELLERALEIIRAAPPIP